MLGRFGEVTARFDCRTSTVSLIAVVVAKKKKKKKKKC
jgi:hypothetical protein